MSKKSGLNDPYDPGGTNVTLKDIAKVLGVSSMTVSRAINNHPNVRIPTRHKILQKASEMGYIPNQVARSLVSRKTFTIGVLIPEISHSFFPEVVRGIEEVTQRKNYQLFLANTAESFEREIQALRAMVSNRVDGVMVSSSQTGEDSSAYRPFIRSGLPLVFFDRCIRTAGASSIRVNDFESCREITRHLIHHGYRKIAHLSGHREANVGKDRLNGYLQAMLEHDLPVDNRWVAESYYNEQGGFEAMKQLLDLPRKVRPRAVVAVNDPVAFGAMDMIRSAGLRIPQDVAITGFTDDIRAGLVHCPLTTVWQPACEVGKQAARKLIQTIENPEEPLEDIQLSTCLKIRQSCGCSATS